MYYQFCTKMKNPSEEINVSIRETSRTILIYNFTFVRMVLRRMYMFKPERRHRSLNADVICLFVFVVGWYQLPYWVSHGACPPRKQMLMGLRKASLRVVRRSRESLLLREKTPIVTILPPKLLWIFCRDFSEIKLVINQFERFCYMWW